MWKEPRSQSQQRHSNLILSTLALKTTPDPLVVTIDAASAALSGEDILDMRFLLWGLRLILLERSLVKALD